MKENESLNICAHRLQPVRGSSRVWEGDREGAAGAERAEGLKLAAEVKG